MNAISFEIRAPMSSWATGGSSIIPTMSEPTWSAVVGMIGSAMGVDRSETEKLQAISNDFAMALTVIRPGIKASDFNTIEAPFANKVKPVRPRTRFQELDFHSVSDLNTTIIKREYVHDAIYLVHVIQTSDAPVVSLEEIDKALRNPVFPLTAGRRSCLAGRFFAKKTTLEEIAPTLTHWDKRVNVNRTPSMIRERRDQLIGVRQFGIRFECVA